MFIRRKFTVTSDGHNFQLDREFNRESSSDEYEVDYRVKHIRESSGKTKSFIFFFFALFTIDSIKFKFASISPKNGLI